MAPTRIDVKSVLPLGRTGGLTENPPRAIAEGLVARFDWNAWDLPPVFGWLQEVGDVADAELRRAFNCGIGLILVVAPNDAADVLSDLLAAGESAFVCGEVARG